VRRINDRELNRDISADYKGRSYFTLQRKLVRIIFAASIIERLWTCTWLRHFYPHTKSRSSRVVTSSTGAASYDIMVYEVFSQLVANQTFIKRKTYGMTSEFVHCSDIIEFTIVDVFGTQFSFVFKKGFLNNL